tara:strand:- start:79 stop:963 length:885 start_codon:yes stop_codon:yes gene_type:complete
MDFNRACTVLSITPPFTLKSLKQHYHKAALRHHPDRSIDPESNSKFQEIGSAYSFLSMYIEEGDACPPDINYTSILDKFISIFADKDNLSKPDLNCIFTDLTDGCRNITLKYFKELDKQTALNVFGYITRYADVLGIEASTIASMREIMKTKMIDDRLVILNPSIDNLLNDELYKLEHNGDIFYVPLWHDEVTYDISGSQLIVKCIPKIDEHLDIDEKNTLIVNIKASIGKVLSDTCINVSLGQKVFQIPASELQITKFQTYTFPMLGITVIDTNNIYNTNNKNDIIINITLTK